MLPWIFRSWLLCHFFLLLGIWRKFVGPTLGQKDDEDIWAQSESKNFKESSISLDFTSKFSDFMILKILLCFPKLLLWYGWIDWDFELFLLKISSYSGDWDEQFILWSSPHGVMAFSKLSYSFASFSKRVLLLHKWLCWHAESFFGIVISNWLTAAPSSLACWFLLLWIEICSIHCTSPFMYLGIEISRSFSATLPLILQLVELWWMVAAAVLFH